MPFGAPFPGGAAVTHSFNGSSSVVATGPPWTSASISFGTIASNRYLVAAIVGQSSGLSITGVTIGGVTATLQGSVAVNGVAQAGIWIAAVPTGASGNVIISATGGASSWDFGVGLYSLYGNHALSADATGQSTANPLSVTLNAPAGCVVIASAFLAANATAVWTNLTKDVQMSFVTPQGSTASTEQASGGSTAYQCNWSNASAQAMAVALWGS